MRHLFGKTFILVIAMAVGFRSFADPVTPERAATVARTFFGSLGAAKSAADLVRVDKWYYVGSYLFVSPTGGWVIVASDDDVKPILGYSPSGTIDPANLPPALKLWLRGYEEQVVALTAARKAKGGGHLGYPDDIAEWHRLEQGIVASNAKSADTVAPLLTTLWDQHYPYNVYCPQGTVSGCAATAQAQFMKFWNYPAFGCGSHSYNPPRTGTTESADFAHTLYDWDNMTDVAGYSSPDSVVDAIGTLLYHCGVSLEMNYGTAASGGSSAYGLIGIEGYHSIDNSLKDNFYYSRDMSVHFKDYGYTNDTWRQLLIDELNLGHPILYGGAAEQGGHGFVCDGYDSRQYMHFNFGWSGTGDGFYPVDSISPGVGGAGGNVTYTFNLQNSALIGAVPDYAMHVSDTLFIFQADGGADSLLFCINEMLGGSWNVNSDAEWLYISHNGFERAGWVHFRVDSLVDADERSAHLIFTQGNDVLSVSVVQVNYNPDNMCPLTIVMHSSRSEGWRGDAHLTVQSPFGYEFASLKLEDSLLDTVQVPVPPSEVKVVWHTGGGSDRFAGYEVFNHYGEELVAVDNAYQQGGEHSIQYPCAHVGISSPTTLDELCTLYPNPATSTLNVRVDGLQQVEIVDLGGRKVAVSNSHSVDISQLPKGHYFVRVVANGQTFVRRFVKR